MAALSIRNLVKITGTIQKQISLAKISETSRNHESFQALRDRLSYDIRKAVNSTEMIFEKSGASPADLGIRSRRAYQWLKFLSSKNNLVSHFDALQRVNLFLPAINRAKKYQASEVEFLFYNLGSFYKVNGNSSSISITAQEVLVLAPDKILIAILASALGNSNEHNKKNLQAYSFSPAYQAGREDLEYLGMKKGSLALGSVYNLRDSFHRVNRIYFQGDIAEPHLIWSSRMTHRKFGHYQWDIDTVMISKTLDQSGVPSYVLDYVMFHELLHKKHGAPLVKQRRTVHTSSFRKEEQQFKSFEKAQQWLAKLARKRKKPGF